ncbi:MULTISPECIES: accessory Sec system translocase SecA2 [Nocardiaceae]|uniref:accessory Sec system translocase SecA2 n=1 Tax=Nocardiaceae TaxID=85025 RepID=UPI000562FB83|nr:MULTISPECIES: accessory Sec system translocase SecA2 [Rhodococcus]OZC61477.1 accessory Sec system translocase SecA2 [Rhodococcus sp. 06-621-2]OZF00112.1 accessory Sec system translocase SecA2 [Rhodococcus sp. 15-1154-1]OZF46248.1 accessory Sec system translocase SecA2 [Rhodococcus sp. 14-2470-1a]
MASGTDRFWKVLGRSAQKGQARSRSSVDNAAGHAEWAKGLSDEDLKAAAADATVSDAAKLDVPRYLALVREASSRALELQPFDVQLLAAVRMLAGDVVEMSTGEGKTLSGALAAIGYVMAGRRVHVVTINDFLARRDAEWMGPLYELLGFTVGWISEGSSAAERRAAYACDVTYASVNEIGFDVLRDHLVDDAADLVTPAPDVALIDEADSVLVDEALVPLVLAGSVKGDVPSDRVFDAVKLLQSRTDFDTDADGRNVFLTDAGAEKLEKELGDIDLYAENHVGSTLVAVNVALHAQVLVKRDVHYIVRDGRVQLINASRGRVAELQRWPDGLQAAVEIKEGLTPTETGEILDTITVQALIGRYATVCGMTGTALAAGEQLKKFYSLGVSVVPPNEPNVRVDEADRVYDTSENRNAAVVAFVEQAHETGQPILIGTHDVAESEVFSDLLDRAGVPHVVLNAKNDAEEAAVVARAGERSAVTVSTQIAGRGTDIKLGGPSGGGKDKDEVAELGGLLVVGTGRHTTERLDNQLRGRAGRQGDPGRSVFFSSWEDEVVTANLGPKDQPKKTDDTGLVTANGVAAKIDHAQRIAEGAMLEVHSRTWRYNQLTAQHRDILDRRRASLLTTGEALELLESAAPDRAAELRETVSEDVLTVAARRIVLFHLDRSWSEYLAHLADVRESIHLRALGRENPLDEYHRIAVDAFREVSDKAIEHARATFESAEITENGIDLGKSGLARPSSTWTYMVHDNPFAGNTANSAGLGPIFGG